ncbi:MAG: signal transduction histidine kinase, LytS [Herbinix sp.]|nr:signal transduction histidine kinase, LytS [Herbinix sp.]
MNEQNFADEINKVNREAAAATDILNNRKQRVSLRRRLLLLVVIIWIVPVLMICYFVTVTYRNDIIDKTNQFMEDGIKNFTYFTMRRIDEAVDISKSTSYEMIIEKAWKNYESDKINSAELYRQIIGNLNSKLYVENRFIMTAFYLTDNPDHLYYKSRMDANYISIYRNEVEEVAKKISVQENSDAHIEIINGRIYIIRNLYTTTNYTKFGTLIMELNKDKLIDGISLNKDYEYSFFINDTGSIISFQDQSSDHNRDGIFHKLTKHYSKDMNGRIDYENDQPYIGLLYQQKHSDFHFGAVLIANDSVLFSQLMDLYVIMIIIMLVIIPVFVYMLYFISHHITNPMSRMIGAVNKMEQGRLGLQVEGSSMPNTEFDVLMEAFNHMSYELKYLFDYAYNEKIARKDAQIIALQSQINPHFLNNTLEMMNWQARMAGDVTVSKMIEALGTLLNHSMDRTNKKLISLSEELRCVDAYLYIISMRFGKRLKIEKEIDPNLLQIKVPQLILQPLIENAVVHGVETVKNGTIQIKIYKKQDNVYLQIINTGKNMTEEDLERVESILNGIPNDPNIGIKSSHESLGIHNVNQRIKLIFGKTYGLTIRPISDGETASTIIVPYSYESEEDPVDQSTIIRNKIG